jgi:hypothetical protein
VAAAGCGLDQAGWEGSHWKFGGSSFSAPIVAGLLATIRSYRPGLSVDQAEAVVLGSTRQESVPVLDATAALAAAGLGQLLQRVDELPSAEPAPTTSIAEPLLIGSGATRSTGPPALEQHRASTRRQHAFALPRASLRLIDRRWLAVHVSNRPRQADVEVALGRSRPRFRTTSIRLRAKGHESVRVRFTDGVRSSRWVLLRVRHDQRSSPNRKRPIA